ncbi:MAG: sugar phosphate isomerase/epimerase family protein [Armatimonadota bacterium]|nr:sugar phosphate isomerase/epimerase family protein [Armatimonadota bacterium]
MRLGVSSYTFTWAVGVPGSPPERPMGAIALLKKANCLGVRVAQFCDNLPLDQLSTGEMEAFRQRARELDVSVEVGTRGIQQEHLLTYLNLAERLESPIVRVVIDTAEHKPAADEIPALLKEVLPDYERAGVCLAIENHDRFTAATLARIVERAESPNVGICLDTVNSFGALEGPKVVVETLAPWVVNLHIKDFCVQRAGHQMGFAVEGRPAGEGRLDVPWLLGKLRQAGRDPNAILELWTPPEDALEATIAKEDSWAKRSVEYLRMLILE